MEETNQNRVLVVEDDDSIRRFVTIQLERSGFEVTESALGGPALSSLHAKKPDVVVLDLNLPDMDGFEFCAMLREVDPYIAIIILTARGGDWEKIKGLELGADDYMVKPFNPLELAARIRTVLRRTSHAVRPERSVLQSGPIRLDLDANKLYKRDCWIELTPKEQLVVKVFLENPDKALSRNELLNLVWGEDFVGDPKTIDVHIRKLREKIEDDSSRPQLIETVWGLGYRWRKDG